MNDAKADDGQTFYTPPKCKTKENATNSHRNKFDIFESLTTKLKVNKNIWNVLCFHTANKFNCETGGKGNAMIWLA